MSENNEKELYKFIQKQLTDKFINQISLANKNTVGIFSTLNVLFSEGEIGELGIFLKIAQLQPVKSETIVEYVEPHLSKSTVYRKLSFYQDKKLLNKDKDGYWRLSEKLDSLKIIADIKKMTDNEVRDE